MSDHPHNANEGHTILLSDALALVDAATAPLRAEVAELEAYAAHLDERLVAAPAAPVRVTEVSDAMVEAGLDAMRSCLLDSRHPHHDSDRKLMRDALTAALTAASKGVGE